MGLPSTGVESLYRNRAEEVAQLLASRHGQHVMVYNLSGRSYDYSLFSHQVLEFPFPDHHNPPLHLVLKAVHSISGWLSADQNHVRRTLPRGQGPHRHCDCVLPHVRRHVPRPRDRPRTLCTRQIPRWHRLYVLHARYQVRANALVPSSCGFAWCRVACGMLHPSQPQVALEVLAQLLT
eukprot:TRINITY_DN68_c0_g1_i8.p1 TRINITY_DN68_c0_g1~~TRINITY_DN68_c0_g1_i8.p1  ORF type:complete len:179 (+),score=11.26 TRINITY_DN68_c0_g1_i8:689-1225(+)